MNSVQLACSLTQARLELEVTTQYLHYQNVP